MTNPPPNPETPWEFLPDDDIREEVAREQLPPAEADAMHIETRPPRLDPDIDLSLSEPDEEPEEVVHYFDDEHPEVPDVSEPDLESDETPEVEDLLIRQHYLPPDDRASSSDSDDADDEESFDEVSSDD